jgi:hypothetical protein
VFQSLEEAFYLPGTTGWSQFSSNTGASAYVTYGYATNAGGITLSSYFGPGGALTIPATISGLPVTGLGTRVFQNIGLTSVTIPNSVTSIGDRAFENTGLTSVTIGNSVTNIGEDAFADTSLTSVTIPNSVTTIGSYAFGYTGLTNLTIPNSVTMIGDYAFWDTGLTSVTIGNSVTTIGSYAFGYTGLSTIYFQGNAPTPGSSVFYRSAPEVYYLPGTTGWAQFLSEVGLSGSTWFLPNPLILNTEPRFGVQTNGFCFMISWATNTSVVVVASTNLASLAWIPLQTNTLTNGSYYFSDPQWTNFPSRFYQLNRP